MTGDSWPNLTPEQVIEDMRSLIDKHAPPSALHSKAEAMMVLNTKAESPPPELVDALRALAESGVEVFATARFPFLSTTDDGMTIHGCLLGKGKAQRAWVSQALYDSVKK